MAGALIGALRVSLSAETSAFERGMKRSQQSANKTAGYIRTRFGSVGASIKAGLAGIVAGLTVGTLIRAGKEALDYAGSLGELASTLGVTTRDLQTFSYAAGQVGISQEELQAGIQKLTISMGKAQLGAKQQAEAFKAIGISLDDLKGKDAGEVFRMIAERLEKVTDRSKRAAVEVALFGKAGAKLDNLLSGSQGSLDELSRAAEELGIVLSDDQIQKADQTADKLEALKTVLKAKIAGEVADNADAILSLANSLGTLIDKIGESLRGWKILIAEFKAGGAAIANLQNPLPAMAKAGLEARFGPMAQSVRVPLSQAKVIAFKSGGGVSNFLAGGGGHKARADHSAEEAARKLYQYQQDELRAQEDILQAKKDLSEDYVEQTSLEIAILDSQRAQYKAQLDEQVRQKDITQAQADRLMALYDEADHTKRMKTLQDEEEQRQRDVAMLEDHDLERKRERLELISDLAETQSERRQVELDLLKLAYEEKRQALQRIIDTSKDAAAIEDARRDLLSLNKNYSLQQQGVLQQTRGPMEDFLASLPTTAAKADEALQRLEVQGFQGLIDAAGQLSEGFDSAADALLQTLKTFISGLLQIQLQRGLAGFLQGGGGSGFLSALGSLFGGSSGGLGKSLFPVVNGVDPLAPLPGFASGGSGIFRGIPGIDRNVLSMNGLPIAKVSYGERFSFGNDNRPGRMAPPPFVFNNYARMSPDEARRTGAQAAAGWTAEMNRARQKGIG